MNLKGASMTWAGGKETENPSIAESQHPLHQTTEAYKKEKEEINFRREIRGAEAISR